MQAGRPIEVEERVTHDDGIHTYISVKFPLHDTSGNIYAVCGIATDITERKVAELQMRDLAGHILDAREEEKNRIARDIHDELGGTLAVLNIDAHWLLRRLSAQDNASALIERIKSMSQRIDAAVHSTRRIIDNLRPALLDDLGLLAAIEWLSEDIQKRTGIECRVKCIEDEANLDKSRAIALFRIFQEVMTNIVRHSDASRVEVEFLHSENEVRLVVADNGCGNTKTQANNSKSYGMLGMKERAEQLGGTIIFSQPQGGGFRVKVTLPLSDAEGAVP